MENCSVIEIKSAYQIHVSKIYQNGVYYFQANSGLQYSKRNAKYSPLYPRCLDIKVPISDFGV